MNALQKQQQAETVAAQQPFTPQLHRSASSSSGAAAAAAPRAQAFGRSSSAGSSSGRFGSSSGALRSISGDDAVAAAPSRNFVQENKAAAAATSRPVKAELRVDEGAAYLQKNEYGQVPAYLLERKLQLAQEQDALMAAKQAAQIPAGSQMYVQSIGSILCTALKLISLYKTQSRLPVLDVICYLQRAVGCWPLVLISFDA